MKILKDTVVSITYDLLDVDGSIIEKVDSPITYLHGGYDGIFPLVEEALHEKSVSDTCSVTMQPDDAFGEYDHSLVFTEKRDAFPEDLAVGMQFEGGEEGSDEDDFLVYTVLEIDGDEVTLDGNHPLAGKTLTFNCIVQSIRPATDEEIDHGHVHDENGAHIH